MVLNLQGQALRRWRALPVLRVQGVKPHLKLHDGAWRCSSERGRYGPFVYGRTMADAYRFWLRAFGPIRYSW